MDHSKPKPAPKRFNTASGMYALQRPGVAVFDVDECVFQYRKRYVRVATQQRVEKSFKVFKFQYRKRYVRVATVTDILQVMKQYAKVSIPQAVCTRCNGCKTYDPADLDRDVSIPQAVCTRCN